MLRALNSDTVLEVIPTPFPQASLGLFWLITIPIPSACVLCPSHTILAHRNPHSIRVCFVPIPHHPSSLQSPLHSRVLSPSRTIPIFYSHHITILLIHIALKWGRSRLFAYSCLNDVGCVCVTQSLRLSCYNDVIMPTALSLTLNCIMLWKWILPTISSYGKLQTESVSIGNN